MTEWTTPDAAVGDLLMFHNRTTPHEPGPYPDAVVVVCPAPAVGDYGHLWVRRYGVARTTSSPWEAGFWAAPRELSPLPDNVRAIIEPSVTNEGTPTMPTTPAQRIDSVEALEDLGVGDAVLVTRPGSKTLAVHVVSTEPAGSRGRSRLAGPWVTVGYGPGRWNQGLDIETIRGGFVTLERG
jgi:hypothetical protein